MSGKKKKNILKEKFLLYKDIIYSYCGRFFRWCKKIYIAFKENISKSWKQLKQKFFLYYYKALAFLYRSWIFIVEKVKQFLDTPSFYIVLFSFSFYGLHSFFGYLNPVLLDSFLHDFAFTVGGIIGASIAILFMISTFALQSTQGILPGQYLNKLIEDPKEKVYFWFLVFLTIYALFIPLIFASNIILEMEIIILVLAFYFIYDLYRELRRRINPEWILTRIRNDAIKNLVKMNNILQRQAQIQVKIFEYKEKEKKSLLDVQYKLHNSWKSEILDNVKYLYEIGLELLDKNGINTFNLTLKYICDIYLEHLKLRNGQFIRVSAGFFGAVAFDDEGFTTDILEYLQSMQNKIVKEKRKENIYYMLHIYEWIIANSLNITYADKDKSFFKGNPLLDIIFAYYMGFVNQLIDSKENDWIWESIKSISKLSNMVTEKTDDLLILEKVNHIKTKLSNICFLENKDIFLKEIVNSYFNQINIAWSKYEDNEIFWGDLFNELKDKLKLLILLDSKGFFISEIFMQFHGGLGNILLYLDKLQEKDRQIFSNKFLKFLKRWSDFLLDIAREMGLENKHIGFSIVSSVNNNLNFIYGLETSFEVSSLESVYNTQFHILSWYFKQIESVESSHLPNLERVLEILLKEVRDNLKKTIFSIDEPVGLYIKLIERHFKKTILGHGYNHPRIIVKLVYLGLLLNKYEKNDQGNIIISKIVKLNKKYLKLNKTFFEKKKVTPNLMGPSKKQLCKEINDLKEAFFSGSVVSRDINYLLKDIQRADWNNFVGKIKYCGEKKKKRKVRKKIKSNI